VVGLRNNTKQIENKKRPNLFQGSNQSFCWGRIHEVEANEIIDSQTLQEEDDIAEVGSLDFGDGVLLQLVLKGPGGVETKTLSRSHATSSASPLVCGSL